MKFRTVLFLFLTSLLRFSCYGYDFVYEGLCFNVLSFTERTCEVVAGEYKYAGSIVIPNQVEYSDTKFSVVQIGKQAFYRCSSLTKVEMEDSIKTIEKDAFRGCISLKEVKLSDNLYKIGGYAFYDCEQLESIIIPPSVTYIEMYAFIGSGLKEVYCLDSPNILYCYNGSQSVGPFNNCPLEIVYLGRNPEDDPMSVYNSDILDDNTGPIKELWFGKYRTYFNVRDVTWDDLEINKIFCRGVNPIDPHINKYFTNKQYLNTTLYVPNGTKNTYEASPTFGKFLKIQEFDADKIKIENIKISANEVEILEGHSKKLHYTAYPPFANDIEINWKSFNENVCIVDMNGLVYGINTGETTVMANVKGQPNIYSVCNVNVVTDFIPVESIEFKENEVILRIDETRQLFAIIRPENASNPVLKWDSLNEDIVNVSENGEITGLKVGSGFVVAQSTDGSGCSDIVKIIVNDADVDSFIDTQSLKSQPIEIYSITGEKIETALQELKQGIYIVKSGYLTKKIYVK